MKNEKLRHAKLARHKKKAKKRSKRWHDETFEDKVERCFIEEHALIVEEGLIEAGGDAEDSLDECVHGYGDVLVDQLGDLDEYEDGEYEREDGGQSAKEGAPQGAKQLRSCRLGVGRHGVTPY